jgi:hypothetical protein
MLLAKQTTTAVQTTHRPTMHVIPQVVSYASITIGRRQFKAINACFQSKIRFTRTITFSGPDRDMWAPLQSDTIYIFPQYHISNLFQECFRLASRAADQLARLELPVLKINCRELQSRLCTFCFVTKSTQTCVPNVILFLLFQVICLSETDCSENMTV